MRKLTTVLAASSLVFAISLAQADETKTVSAMGDNSKPMMKHHRGNKGDDKRSNDAFADIQLTGAQRQQMAALKQQLHATFPNRAQMEKQYASVHNFMVSDKFDEAAVRAQLDANSKINNEVMLRRIKIRNQMYNLLTPEQKKQFNANYEKRMQETKTRFADK